MMWKNCPICQENEKKGRTWKIWGPNALNKEHWISEHVCCKCAGTGHAASRCASKGCEICGKAGKPRRQVQSHDTKDCKTAATAGDPNGDVTTYLKGVKQFNITRREYGAKEDRYPCRHCGLVNHTAENCKSSEKEAFKNRVDSEDPTRLQQVTGMDPPYYKFYIL